MQLRCGQLLWPELSRALHERAPLAKHERCDVLIVGSGVTGALLADALSQEGLDVVVVDKRPMVRGSTPASTALLQYEIDTPLTELTLLRGQADAEAAYLRSLQGVLDLQQMVKDLAIDCDLAQRPSLYLARKHEDAAFLRREADARRAIGIAARFLDETELRREFQIHRPAAIVSEIALEMDPWRFTNQLWSRAIERGVRVYDRTALKTELWSSAHPSLHTTGGQRIDARYVVFATGYESPEMFPELAKLCELHATFAMASAPLDESKLWPSKALIWEKADPYLYLRTTADHRVIIGGRDESLAGDLPGPDRIQHAAESLAREAADVYAPLAGMEVEYAWTGAFATTADGLPYIGPIDAAKTCHVALGYGGNGITFSVIAAQLITDAILSRANESARLFAVDRRPVASGESNSPKA